MTVKYYMDVHVPRAVTLALRLRGIDVMTAQQDGANELEDDELLRRATSWGRVLVTKGRIHGCGLFPRLGRRRQLTQAAAAELIGVGQPKVSAMLADQFRGEIVVKLKKRGSPELRVA